MAEYEFSSDAARIGYAEDKVREYTELVEHDQTQGYHWERTDPNGSKLTHDLTPIEATHLAHRLAFNLSRELSEIGIVYRGTRTPQEHDHE